MAFSVSDYQELVRLLGDHPDLRAGLRNLLFVDERDDLRKVLGELAAVQKRTVESLAALTERVEQLAEAQRRTEQRLEQLAEAQRRTEERLTALTERVDQLAEAQRRTEERLTALTERVDQLAEAQRHTEERLTALTERVDQLAEAQRRTEERLTALTERVDQLAEAQRRTEQRLDQLAEAQRRTEQRLDQLAEAQRRTEQRLEQLAEAQRRTEQRLEQLAEAQRHTEQGLLSLTAQVRLLTNEMAQVKGSLLEQRYRDRAPAYFAPLMRRIHALSSEELAALLEEAELSGALTEAERQELLNTDVVVRGLWRLDGMESYLAVEVSGGVGAYDVERAAARATLLSRITGKRAIPVVAGQAITDEGERAAKRLRAWCVLDGRCVGPSDSETLV